MVPERKSGSINRGKLKGPVGGCTAYQLKVTLDGTEPPIWRRVLVPGGLRLDSLHSVLQEVMGWTDSHLHMFEEGENRYSVLELLEDDDETKEETEFRLRDLARREGESFVYEYDFGDSWRHVVVVESIQPVGKPGMAALCLDGAGACPPEDVGGTGGFVEFLKTMRGPDSEERKEFVQWLGREFDPQEFSTKTVNKALAKLKLNV